MKESELVSPDKENRDFVKNAQKVNDYRDSLNEIPAQEHCREKGMTKSKISE